MDDFQIKYFAQRLKKIAKEQFGGIGKLAEAMGLKNLSNYTKEREPLEPRANFLYRLAKLDIDIHYLLTRESYVNKEMESEITKLKAAMYDLQNDKEQLTAEKERLIKTIETLREENKKLEESNKMLGAQYSRVAEVNAKYSKRKLKK